MFLMVHELMFLYIVHDLGYLSRSVFSTCHLGNSEVGVFADNIVKKLCLQVSRFMYWRIYTVKLSIIDE